MQRNRKLRRWIDSSMNMQYISDFVFLFNILNIIFSTCHSPQATKASDILCLTNSGSIPLAHQSGQLEPTV